MCAIVITPKERRRYHVSDNQTCARICARDVTGQNETRQTQDGGNGFEPQLCQDARWPGQRRRREAGRVAVLAGVIERRAGGGNASARVEALNLHIGVVPRVTCDFTQVLSGPSFSCFATARGREAGL